MLANDDKSLSKRDKKMTDVAQAHNLFRKAFPVERYGKVDALLYAAHRFLEPLVQPRIDRPFTMRRVRSLHEGKLRRVDGAELDALKIAQIEELKREHRETIKRLDALEKALAVASPLSAGETLVSHSEDAHPMG